MEHEQAQTAHKWVTVDEAFLLCQEANLDRTKKTIRSWCRQEHVESQKQTTPTGERWMLEASSLAVKIRNELEFQRQSEPVQTGSDEFEQVRTKDTPVHTSAHQSEQVRETSENEQQRIDELEAQVRSLEIDKAVRDKHVDFLSKQNEEGQRNLLSQSRYIGHLETKVLQLGGEPDQTFLNPPTPEAQAEVELVEKEEPQNPNQRPFDIHT